MGTEDDLLRFVERFALTLRDSGMAPMPARVLSYLLSADGGQHTAGELAEALQVSPAAISGAVRFLVDGGLVLRDREPGTRSDLYSLYPDNLWPRMTRAQLGALTAYEARMREGAELVGDRPGGARLAESADFVAYMAQELHAMLDRWDELRAARG